MLKEKKLSHYINNAKSVTIESYEKKIRIAILSSFTMNGLDDTLRVKCSEINVGCMIYLADYKQYNQEFLNPQSGLYKFNPDVVFFILDNRTILGEPYHLPHSLSDENKRNFIHSKLEEINNIIKIFTSSSKSKLVISNIQIPNYSPYGIHEMHTDYGLFEMTNDFNSNMKTISKKSDSVFIYDLNGFFNRFGERNVFDYRQFFYGDIKISLDYIPYLAHDLMGYIKTILGLNKKCIVLDLDNTLWGGIIGEDGFERIRLGQDPIGKAYVEFQYVLLGLHQRGIILAINSKNNLEDAMKVIKEHPNMILREQNFSSLRINWNDKVTNLKEIAGELNIGLDSIVFLDDDPVNRELIKTMIPEVLTPDLPNDSSTYAETVMDMNDFNLLKITDEDLKRGAMYYQNQQRQILADTAKNLDDFLNQLNIKLTIKTANDYTIPRISQLTLKTNQFNLTTKRYQEEEIKKFVLDPNYLVGCAQVEDKFGDNGITGVFIVKKENKSEWLIDTFLLSCRIIGRGVESAILSYILKNAKDNGIVKVKGEFISTKKNKPCESFFLDSGFQKEGTQWVYDTNNTIRMPKHIACSVEK